MKKIIKSLFIVTLVFGLTVTLTACGSSKYKGTYVWTFMFPEMDVLEMLFEDGIPGMRLNVDNTVETLTGGQFTEYDQVGTYTYNDETKEIVCTFADGMFAIEMAGTLDEGVLTLNVSEFEIALDDEEESESTVTMDFDILMVFEYNEEEGYYICTSAKTLEFEVMTMTIELKKNNKGTQTMSVPILEIEFKTDITYSESDKKVIIKYPDTSEKQSFTVVDGNLKMDISDEKAAEMIAEITKSYEQLGEGFDISAFDFIFVKQAA